MTKHQKMTRRALDQFVASVRDAETEILATAREHLEDLPEMGDDGVKVALMSLAGATQIVLHIRLGREPPSFEELARSDVLGMTACEIALIPDDEWKPARAFPFTKGDFIRILDKADPHWITKVREMQRLAHSLLSEPEGPLQ